MQYQSFKVGEAAARLGICTPYAKKLFDDGVLEGCRINTHRRIYCWSVRKFMKEHGIPARFFHEPPNFREILRPGQVARLMGCSVSVVQRLMKSGKLHGWRLDRDRRFYAGDVLQYFQAHKMEAAEQNLLNYLKERDQNEV